MSDDNRIMLDATTTVEFKGDSINIYSKFTTRKAAKQYWADFLERLSMSHGEPLWIDIKIDTGTVKFG